MDWGADTWWWIAAGALVAAEMTTGTFYLLMLALGALGAAIAARLGLSFAAQLTTAAVLGGGAVAMWHVLRQRRAPSLPAQANRDVILDIGERVHVNEWAADGSAQVSYRGAQWPARYAGNGAPEAGEFIIRSIDGNRLMLGR